MYTILETTTSRVLFSKFDNQVLENQTAIEKECNIENPDNLDIYFNYETETFYLKD